MIFERLLADVGLLASREVSREVSERHSLAKSLFRSGKGVIHHVIPAPPAVGSQVGLNAVPHRRGYHLGRQIADHVGPVGVTVSAGIEHQLFSLGFVLLAQSLPVLSPQQVATERIRAKPGSHGWKPCRIKGLKKLPFRSPLVTGQQPQGPGLGFAARGNLFIRAPEPSLANLQVLQLFGAQAKGTEQLEGKPPARIWDGLQHCQDVRNGNRRGDRTVLP